MAAEYRPPAYTVVTRPLMRGVVGVIFHLLGRIRVTGKENIPLRQPYIVAGDHVSIIDPPAVLCFWPEIIDAIGAIVVVRTGGTTQKGLVQSGTSYLSQNDMRHTGTPYLVEIMNRFDLLPVKNFHPNW